jgi:hypothetical protein
VLAQADLQAACLLVLVLVHLRKGETFAELAAGFAVRIATGWRYVTETVALLAARAPKLRPALRASASGTAGRKSPIPAG